ncbi:mitochondrial inner membrane protease subunit 2 isoform X1 [Pelodiscus sinensis]|uniref:mitochondrial inner membrane protease subunit 2 isoform X1 n=1 Tax=Pelodiscus sinensis TaxID=13735 RepID=UPI003F6C55F1
MAQAQGLGKRYLKAFFKGFFVAVPVTVTFLDRVACVARVEGASMQPSLNPGGRQVSDVVLLNHWSIRNYEVQRGDIVSLVSPRNPEQKIIKRVIALEGDIIKTIGYKNKYVRVPHGHIWVEGDHHGHSLDSNVFGPPHHLRVQDTPPRLDPPPEPGPAGAPATWRSSRGSSCGYRDGRSLLDFYMLVLPISCGLQSAGRSYNLCCLQNEHHFTLMKIDLHVHDGEMK